ncbi:MAG TPA: tripartite tricarboxylate transporter substrate binding protein [Burkholderiales bacterium]|jgi:tripartite-type tricarboxylate transporter receptor subunit TctC|nr:tripartite tricarboxylate transporter substrate binding protein [Burkholderiales bacterium]
MSMTGFFKGIFIAVISLGITTSAAWAQNEKWPQRPVEFVLGFPAGGASDIVARALATQLKEVWGQSVVVDNRPGATGIIASQLAARAKPDGYTVLLVSSSYVNNIILRPHMSFDPLKDLVPVGRVAIVPNVAVVPTSLPVKNIADLIKLAKEKPGSLAYASGGTGTGTHLATELLKHMTHIDMLHVPYKGTPPALLDLMTSRVQFMLSGLPPALPYIHDGKLRAIGVTSPKRSSALPDVPAIAETVPGYDATTWYGFMVPAGTPQPIITKLNHDIVQALDAPNVKKALSFAGFEPDPSTPEEFGKYMREELVKWGKVIKDANIHVD